jgi:hypothetical protein
MPNGEHPFVDGNEVAGYEPPIDEPLRKAELQQLAPSDDAVLALGKPSDRRVAAPVASSTEGARGRESQFVPISSEP